MAEIVLVLGQSGHGKSTSLRNFKDNEICVISVAGKRLPFQSDIKTINTSDYRQIVEILKKNEKKVYVIDDSQYLMAFEMFGRVKEKGYDKFSEIGCNFQKLIEICKKLPEDVIVYFLHHIELTDMMTIKAKTIGKMLDNHLTLEGVFTIVLMAERGQNGYQFVTQTDGRTPAKSPMGMFDTVIDNDLKMVDTNIRKYWNIPQINVSK